MVELYAIFNKNLHINSVFSVQIIFLFLLIQYIEKWCTHCFIFHIVTLIVF